VKVLTVVGARPQFVKCAPVSRLLRARHTEILVHTGQHHDDALSAAFFRDLEIPEPDENLGIFGGLHGEMTGRMLERLERSMLAHHPDWVLIYGDTNSTLAGALAAAKLQIPVAHVEAGLRSFNRRMPEEINRLVADRLSARLFCPTKNAVELLAAEGITEGVVETGDVMLDSVLANRARAEQRIDLGRHLAELGFRPGADGRFAFATVHRAENTDQLPRLAAILRGLAGCPLPVLLPLHPRTRAVLAANPGLTPPQNVHLVSPQGYLETLRLASAASLILTDSGGLQKEALFLGVRCVTLRDETEWVETIAAGVNALAGADADRIAALAVEALAAGPAPTDAARAFGDGRAAERIVGAL
jgi:UDP-N-acetylglucosamine 2-epimerase